ncbi:Acyl-CoA synthetase (AMP-forming)/AMP-acid ligase II [Micromonospora pallida]|uniref:Acyl-CoA synthetase (AMP-forming)/AMP-acid ligase II n=1 Tax=Micromonospora pallida TaxID=145854 RepID=A0A1C6RUQ4_9ACTN|nr:AMP-binding protein [Micromonospora pallida]SCL20789.1 Acyl-CoA synthetase (AMP-forming)/AMP-acid ligase II [Micromonospora pallida]
MTFLHTLVAQAAARQPEAMAVRDATGSWTYAELDRYSRGYAAGLHDAGVGVGDRVLIRAAAERWVLAAVYACSHLGAVAVPLSADLRPAQWAHVIDDAEPALTLTGPPPVADTAIRSPVDPQSPVLFLYTSGSTARPKAVVCPHRQVLFAVGAIAERLGYRPDDVILCRLPLSFDYGLYQAFLAAAAGACLVLQGPGGDGALLATIRRHGVTVVPVVPSLATILIRLARRGSAPSVRLVTNTGQELTATHLDGLREAFPSAAIQLMYGTTECKRVTIAEPDGDLARPGSLGKPLPGTTLVILDPSGRPAPAGEEGQIVVAGPHLMSGYWKDEQLTARTYRRDPATGRRLLHTGDYGHLDADGNLFFHGRRDHLFKQRGVRVSVAEVEAAARQIPGVQDVALLPPGDGRDATLFAVTDLEPGEVLMRLHELLEPAKVPASCRVLPAIPVGSTGKTDRAALSHLLEDDVRVSRHA